MQKIKTEIQRLLPHINVSTLELPQNHTLNDMLITYNPEGLLKWFEGEMTNQTVEEHHQYGTLQIISETEYFYKGEELTYRIKGIIPSNITQLEMHLEMSAIEGKTSLTTNIDFFNSGEVERLLYDFTEKDKLNFGQAMIEVATITNELKQLRRQKYQSGNTSSKESTKIKQEADKLLSQENLFEILDQLIEESGVTGEKYKRLFLYLLAASYKTNYNLHSIIQTPNSDLGAEMVRKIARLIPEKDTYVIDTIAQKSFRYYVNNAINRKLLIIEDYHNVLNSKAMPDLMKIQSSNLIKSDVPKKSVSGLLSTIQYDVNGHISSIGTFTNSQAIFSNEPKTVIVELENSKEQLDQLIQQDCLKLAGLINEEQQYKSIFLLQGIINNVHSQNVVNPFAPKIMLPSTFPSARIITMQLLNFIALITIFKQRQRQLDEQGRIMTEKQDVEFGIKLYFKAVTLGQEGLDTATSEFFTLLKRYVLEQEKGKETTFSTQEIITALKLSKTTVNRHLKTLTEFEYIKQDGFINKGFDYQITNWDSSKKIKDYLMQQFQEKPSEPNADGSLE